MKRVICFVLGWWLLCVSVVVGQLVEIPDPNLRQAVRQVLNLSDNTPITEQDMLRYPRTAQPIVNGCASLPR